MPRSEPCIPEMWYETHRLITLYAKLHPVAELAAFNSH